MPQGGVDGTQKNARGADRRGLLGENNVPSRQPRFAACHKQDGT